MIPLTLVMAWISYPFNQKLQAETGYHISWQANIDTMLLKILTYIPNKNGSKNEIHISRESKKKLNEK